MLALPRGGLGAPGSPPALARAPALGRGRRAPESQDRAAVRSLGRRLRAAQHAALGVDLPRTCVSPAAAPVTAGQTL